MTALRFLFDENIPRDLGLVVREEGHDVAFLIDFSPGIPDEEVLERATSERRVLVTEDSDFGRLVFGDGLAAIGIVLIRIAPWKGALRKTRLRQVLRQEAPRLPGHFTTLSERTTRFRPIGLGR